MNVPAANRLLKKANEQKKEFKAEDLVEFLCICDRQFAADAVFNSINRLEESDMEELYSFADDQLIRDICAKRGFKLPEDLIEEDLEDETEKEPNDIEDELSEPDDWELSERDDFELEEPDDDPDMPESKGKKGGFLTTLFAVMAGLSAGINDKGKQSHSRRCNGDCAHCPPHYGYRYGRWYYGHGHTEGCEFGGNKGGGI